MDKLPASAGSGARWHGFMHTIQKYIKDEGEITMKVTVICSHLCPDTLYALQQLAAAGAEIDFKDILSCHADLKAYLNLRDNSDLYAQIRGTERLGIPCFVKEDGTTTLNLAEVLK